MPLYPCGVVGVDESLCIFVLNFTPITDPDCSIDDVEALVFFVEEDIGFAFLAEPHREAQGWHHDVTSFLPCSAFSARVHNGLDKI